jgi:hypothetical protein
MSYSVDLKRDDTREETCPSAAEMYFGEIGKTFQSLRKAREYLLQFEDWEQGMLEIVDCGDDEIPF